MLDPISALKITSKRRRWLSIPRVPTQSWSSRIFLALRARVSPLCCFEAFAFFHYENFSYRAFGCQAHQGRASGSSGVLSRKSRSKKWKTLNSVEKDRPARGKILKLVVPSSSPSTHVRMPGHVLSPPTEIPKNLSLQSHSSSAAKAKDSSGRTVERSLEVMPITVWNPPA